MIVKIQPPAPNLTNAVAYNDQKMDSAEGVLSEGEVREYLAEGNTGHVLGTRNVPETSTLENEFSRLKMKNAKNSTGRKLENPTFHMSINPGVKDKPLTEDQIVQFANELMDRLGYGECPYRIYRHDDTGRTHFHIVGIRIGQDGKKVKDAFENSRCEKYCKELAGKYGYIYGLQEDEQDKKDVSLNDDKVEEGFGPNEFFNTSETLPYKERQEDTQKLVPVNPIKTARNKDEPTGATQSSDGTPDSSQKSQKPPKTFIPPYDPDSNVPASEQYRLFHAEAMKWAFTTPEQYAGILRFRYNTDVKLMSEGQEDSLEYTGLGKYGNPATTPVNEAELGLKALEDVLRKCSETNMKKRKAQRERLEKLAEWAAEKAESWEEFRKIMERKGVYVLVSWTEQNEAFGITWLDRATKCAWKGSETDKDLKWMKDVAEKKGWTMTRHKRHEKAPNPNNEKKKTAMKSGRASTNLSDHSVDRALQKLFEKNRVEQTRRSNADASKNKSEIKYGEENDNDIVI